MEEKLLQERGGRVGGTYERKANPKEPGQQTQLINRTSFRNCVLSWRRREHKSKEDRQFNRGRHLEQLQKKRSEGRAPNMAGEELQEEQDPLRIYLQRRTSLTEEVHIRVLHSDFLLPGLQDFLPGPTPALFNQAPPSSGTLQAWTYQRDS